MTLHEIAVFNNALDGKDIVGLPTIPGSFYRPIQVQKVKHTLVKKGYLYDSDSLTELGFRTMQRMKNFKNADRYVTINNMTLSLPIQGQSVGLFHNMVRETYELRPVDVDDWLTNVFGLYTFLNIDSVGCTKVLYKISPSELGDMYPAKPNEQLRLSKILKGAIVCNVLLFSHDDILHQYDFHEEMLSVISKCDLDELISLEVK